MKMQIVLTEDDVDRIILEWLKDEYKVETHTRRGVLSGIEQPKNFVTMEWTRGPITVIVSDEPTEHHKPPDEFTIEPIVKAPPETPPVVSPPIAAPEVYQRQEPYPLKDLGLTEEEARRQRELDNEIPF